MNKKEDHKIDRKINRNIDQRIIQGIKQRLNTRIRHGGIRSVALLLVMVLVTGCSLPFAKEQETAGDVSDKEQQHPVNYKVPISVPNVLVDQNGYEMKSTKTALFRGENLQKTFEVIDADSGETVYTGDIIARGIDEKTGEYISYGAFSELERVGTYYIQTAVIGQSYRFVIEENMYTDLIYKMEMALSENRDEVEIADEATGGWNTDSGRNKNVTEGCNVAQTLLLTNEFYPEIMTDDVGIADSGNQVPDILDEVKYEIDWLLKMQNPKTGGVYAGIARGKLQGESVEATADFASAMALFYNNYVYYDKAYAQKCLQMAERAWKYLQVNATVDTALAQYNAAAQLFKATYNVTYHTYIKEHYDAVYHEEDNKWNRELYGDVAYLTTVRKVDTNICKMLMDKWMDKAEAIVEESKKNSYFVIEDTNEEMLSEMLCLSVIDHVITNHEYVTVLESHLHYFMGRNTDAVCYIEEYGKVYPSKNHKQEALTKQSQQTATLLFMISEIVTEDTEEFGE